MTTTIEIPGRGRLELESVLLDVNGTLTDRGVLIDGVAERLAELSGTLRVVLVSADTFGTLDDMASLLHVEAVRVADGSGKLKLVERFGASRVVAIGNGKNDAPALEAAGLGIAVIGREGASTAALAAADVVCCSIFDALDLLLDERALVATLRS